MDKSISTGLKSTFLVHCVLALIFGVLFLLFPQVWGKLAGIQIIGHELYRLYGATILALGLSSWLAYRAKYWESVRILVLAEIFGTALATVVTLNYIIRYSFPPIYWVLAVLMAGFAALFTLFYLRQK